MKSHLANRCRARREQLKRLQGLSAERQDRILVLTVLCVPSLLDSGLCACNTRDGHPPGVSVTLLGTLRILK